MEPDFLKAAFKLASHAVKSYDHALEFQSDHLRMVIKPVFSKVAPKLKVIFKF